VIRSAVFPALAFTWILVAIPSAGAAVNDWAEGTPGMENGASRDYYNRAGLLPWRNFMGDWRDAAGTPQGAVPFAVATVIDNDTARFVEWDVTDLVQTWADGDLRPSGFFLRPVGGSGTFDFRSREHTEPGLRPELVVVTDTWSGSLTPVADTYLDTSTYTSLGDESRMRVSTGPNHALVRFDLGARVGSTITSATLRLHTYQQFGGGSMDIGVFLCDQGHDFPPSPPIPGLADAYHRDENIVSHPDVYYFDGFESADWVNGWTHVGGNLEVVGSDPALRFEPLDDHALRVTLLEGTNTAMNVGYHFLDETGAEPDEAYFRYYLRFADDWEQTVDGGKMPGFAGTYGVAGWGGRPSDGTNGWSTRGTYYLSVPSDNPLAGTTPLGNYVYHADMSGSYGDVWLWQEDYRGLLRDNRWHSVEQYVRMNTPAVNDGVLRAWVDGRLAFEKTDLRFRDVTSLRIEEVWMNVYHGGTAPSPYDQHLYIDNLVIASSYIGPAKGLSQLFVDGFETGDAGEWSAQSTRD
jgi:hypothetical protein